LGIVDWGLGIVPNPQSPITNPQSPIPIYLFNKFENLKNKFSKFNILLKWIITNKNK